MKNAAELVAATHVADGHDVGIDRAGPVHEQVRLADLAQEAQSIMSIMQSAAAVSTWTAKSEHFQDDCVRLRA